MLEQIPGPQGRFLVGSAPEFNGDTLNFLLGVRSYGDMVKVSLAGIPLIIVQHPDLMREVLVTQAPKFKKNAFTINILKPYVGDGLFSSDGELWKHQRRLIQPLFHTKYIGNYAETMVQYADDLARKWAEGGTRQVDRDMNQLTMRIIAKTLFDADVEHEAGEVGDSITEGLHLIEQKLQSLLPLPVWIPTHNNRRTRVVVDRQHALVQGFIEVRRRDPQDRIDLLSLLLNARDEADQPMSDRQIQDEALTLFNAGHETTSVAMMWTWYLLSQHPEVEAKLHAELDRVLGGKLPTLADLPQLPYTEMILKEALRLFPPAYGTSRDALEPVTIGGYTLQKGQTIFMNFYGVQRDARFFPDPNRFDPERFSPEREKDIPKYAYLPFGGGPRVCIGNAFAMMEAQLLLATLAQRFSLSVAPGFEVIPQRLFTLRARYGMKMVVKNRVPELQGAL
jgi:cytochrome P450